MKNIFCLLIAFFAFAPSVANAGLKAISTPTVGSIGAVAQTVPVCNQVGLSSDEGLTGGTTPQLRHRLVVNCPGGAKYVQFIYAGVWKSPPETDFVDPVPFAIGIENPPCTAGSTCSVTPVKVTCNGGSKCTVPTYTNTSGATYAQGFIVTDPIPVNVAAGGSLGIRQYIQQQSGQKVAFGWYNDYALGESCSSFSSVSDNSTSTSVASPNTAACLRPVAIVGIPQVPTKSACIIGDSLASGYVVYGLRSVTIGSGGSSYAQSDVGAILTVPGGSSAGTAIAAQIIITQVNSGSGTGAVTGVAVYQQGSYTTAGVPTGTQTPTGTTTGSGLTVTFTTGSAYDFGDAYGNKGFLKRAFGANAVYASFTRGSDTIANWASRDYSEIAMIAATGCKNAITELGVNDVTAGTSKATIEADQKILWAQLKGLGINVFAETITPVATSTDGFVTTTNQTTNTYNSTRTGYNDDLRSSWQTWGLAGIFDVANAVESSLDSGLWAVNGSVCAYTTDGTHVINTGMTAASGAINLNQLQ